MDRLRWRENLESLASWTTNKLRSKKYMSWLTFLSPCCFISGVILVISAVGIYFILQAVLKHKVKEKSIIREGNLIYDEIQNPTPPLFKDIYYFNLTNPEQFQAGAKPQLVEVGPYSFRETRTKQVLKVSPDGTLLMYNQTRIFKYSQETTRVGLQENDTICTINLALVVAASLLEGGNDPKTVIGRSILRGIFLKTGANLYICQPPTLVWKYKDDLTKELHTNPLLKVAGANSKTDFIDLQPNNTINDSYPSIIYTGLGNLDKLGQFVEWDGNKGSLNHLWPNGKGANDINGTEGMIYHPFIDEDDTLEGFNLDSIRSFKLVYKETYELRGIRVFRYELDKSTFLSAFTYPENARWGSWNPDGLLFLGALKRPIAPVFASKPHFLDGDPVLREKVSGLKPNRAIHETVTHIEPLTGAAVQANARVQVNIQVNQSTHYDQLKNVNGTVYFPVFYYDEFNVEVPSLYLDNGLSTAYLIMDIMAIELGLLLGIAAVCFIVALSLNILWIKMRYFDRPTLCNYSKLNLDEQSASKNDS